MKKHNVFPVILILLFNFVSFAQTAEETTKIKNNLIKIIELSVDKNYNEAAKFIGNDVAKGNSPVINIKNSKEFNTVKRICKSIDALVNISNVYEINTPYPEIYNDKNIFTTVVDFNSGKQVISKKFRFIKFENNFFLIKID